MGTGKGLTQTVQQRHVGIDILRLLQPQPFDALEFPAGQFFAGGAHFPAQNPPCLIGLGRGGKLFDQALEIRGGGRLIAAHLAVDPSDAEDGAGQLVAIGKAAEDLLIVGDGRVGLADIVTVNLAGTEQVIEYFEIASHHHFVAPRRIVCNGHLPPLAPD